MADESHKQRSLASAAASDPTDDIDADWLPADPGGRSPATSYIAPKDPAATGSTRLTPPPLSRPPAIGETAGTDVGASADEGLTTEQSAARALPRSGPPPLPNSAAPRSGPPPLPKPPKPPSPRSPSVGRASGVTSADAEADGTDAISIDDAWLVVEDEAAASARSKPATASPPPLPAAAFPPPLPTADADSPPDVDVLFDESTANDRITPVNALSVEMARAQASAGSEAAEPEALESQATDGPDATSEQAVDEWAAARERAEARVASESGAAGESSAASGRGRAKLSMPTEPGLGFAASASGVGEGQVDLDAPTVEMNPASSAEAIVSDPPEPTASEPAPVSPASEQSASESLDPFDELVARSQGASDAPSVAESVGSSTSRASIQSASGVVARADLELAESVDAIDSDWSVQPGVPSAAPPPPPAVSRRSRVPGPADLPGPKIPQLDAEEIQAALAIRRAREQQG